MINFLAKRASGAAVILAMAVALSFVGCAPEVDHSIQVLAFGSKHCGPCRRDAATREEIAKRVSVVYVDVDLNPQVADVHQVQFLPLYIVYVNRMVVLRTSDIVEVYAYVDSRSRK